MLTLASLFGFSSHETALALANVANVSHNRSWESELAKHGYL